MAHLQGGIAVHASRLVITSTLMATVRRLIRVLEGASKMRNSKVNFVLTVSFIAMFAISMYSQRPPALEQRRDGASQQVSQRTAIKLPAMPPTSEALLGSVRSPEQIDDATNRLGIPPRLLNFNLATPIDLSAIGLGKAVHIPVQISNREGGRKSLYFLNSGEEVLAGICVTDDGIALRYVKRLIGRGLPAKTGDVYETRITTVQGKTVYQEQGRLEVLDAEHGKGQLVPVDKGPVLFRSIWVLWSTILVESENKQR